MKKALIYFLVVLFFVFFSILATYPLITRMDTAVKNFGDPLFNIWVINWDIHKFLTGVNNFFDANIFYPHTNTLAYSEHLIPQALLALPVFLIRAEPIFIYNFLYILSFILSGLGMFFLVEHLTKNRFAALLSGFMFAFCSFRFGHQGHLQILTTQWIPFTFLFLHKFIERQRIRHLIFFSIFFILQALSCSYYAFFLSAALLIMFGFFLLNKKINLRKFLGLILAGLIIGIVLFPFFKPYYKLKKEMDFERPISEVEFYSARAENYLAADAENKLLSKLTRRFVRPEGKLLPGIMALVLAMVGIFKLSKGGNKDMTIVNPVRSKSPKVTALDTKCQGTSNGVNRILEGLILLDFLLIIFLNKWDGFDFGFGAFRISLHSIRNPFYFLIFLVIGRWFNAKDRQKFLALDYRGNFYLLLAAASFIFSLGPSLIIGGEDTGINLPYLFLYNYIPGFQGLRVPARWACFVVFAVSVLAGFGLKRIFIYLKKRSFIVKWGVAGLLFAALFTESIHFPVGYRAMPKEVPPVYQWLAKQKINFAILELPMSIDGPRAHYEARYMYWSIYHWKSLVNGYSGFFPPDYWPINEAMQKFPAPRAISILGELGIKYVIVHFGIMDEERIRRIKRDIGKFKEFLRIKKIFGQDYVIEIIP